MSRTELVRGQTYRDIEYGRAGDKSLRLDAFVPDGAGPFPAAILVHGGGWVAGDRTFNLEPLFDPLREAGFAWFSISYSFVSQFSVFGSAIQDVQQAVRYVRAHAAHYRLDLTGLVLIGESAGGQLAAMAALDSGGPEVQAVIALYAPSDLEHLAHASERVAKEFPGAVRGIPWAGLLPARLRELSPIQHVRAGMPPFLLIHGTADPLVPFEQSEAMCRAIRKAGGVCDLVAVRGGGHGMRWWESARLTTYKRLMIGWLQKHVASARFPTSG